MQRIAQQARHQISAYQSLRREFVVPSTAKCPIKIEISIRHGAVDYSDSFLWDWRAPTSPEEFAARTISDLGLPLQMIQAVAAQIRMQTLAALMGVEEKPAPTATAEAAGAEETVAGPTVKPVATQSYSDVMADVHAQATIPQPTQVRAAACGHCVEKSRWQALMRHRTLCVAAAAASTRRAVLQRRCVGNNDDNKRASERGAADSDE